MSKRRKVDKLANKNEELEEEYVIPPVDDEKNNGIDLQDDDTDQEDQEEEEDELLPEIIPDYASDTSDEETLNTIGNVPLEWYEDLPHIGYDIEGRRIGKPASGDALDAFLDQIDNPDSWRSVLNKLEGKEQTLTSAEIEVLKRVQSKMFPDVDYDPYQPTVEWFTSKVETQPLNSAPEPKRRFIPSKVEASRILKIVRAIRKGWIKPKSEQTEDNNKPAIYDIWEESPENPVENPLHIPAPKLALPDHRESYNPPAEYIPTEKEIEDWHSLDPQDRPYNFIPKKHSSLRQVSGYARFVQERFDRCLDLYLCPRIQKKKLNIDPESLIPQLPNRNELEPFPKTLSISYIGHTKRIRCFGVDPSGKWLASGSDDCTVRYWEVSTGRCVKVDKFDSPIQTLAWNPNAGLAILAVAIEKSIVLSVPETCSKKCIAASDTVFAALWNLPVEKADSKWTKPAGKEFEDGRRAVLGLTHNVAQIIWHRKGDYFATVAPDAGSSSVAIHQLSKKSTQYPFKKSKGLVQKVIFHPNKPYLFVATQRFVRVYNLLKQELVKRLQPGVKWISSIDVHPQGDNVIIGSYDKRVCWFDMDLSAKPYKTLRYHKAAVRNVAYHKRYPLFASCSDDGLLNVFHGLVYGDLEKNPLIVPLKSFKAHDIFESLGALHCEFHPTQPWIFSCGKNGDSYQIRLFS
ncbi:Ribosome biogenesis protein 1 [Chytridiales sp. JEL 0842]|nr:Ribosome biogenesis protein 1 [Chytridiales sp. JEL 0842]